VSESKKKNEKREMGKCTWASKGKMHMGIKGKMDMGIKMDHPF